MSQTNSQTNTAEVVNLKTLAEATNGSANIAGATIQVEQLKDKRKLEPTSNLLLIVLEGELIVDLPYGDFRILRKNDSLFLDKETEATLNPVDTVIFIQVIFIQATV